jgi:hypothetical protein
MGSFWKTAIQRQDYQSLIVSALCAHFVATCMHYLSDMVVGLH